MKQHPMAAPSPKCLHHIRKFETPRTIKESIEEGIGGKRVAVENASARDLFS